MSAKTCYIKNNKTYTDKELDVIYFNTKVNKGFLSDFNFEHKEYKSIKEALGYNSNQMVDLISKFIATEKGIVLDKSVAYIAFSLLGKSNSKIKSELRYKIRNWDKYTLLFDKFKQQVGDTHGYVENSTKWKNLIRDKIIVEYLGETIVEYHNNPVEFKKIMNKKWTQEDFTFIQKIYRKIINFFSSKEKNLADLKNIGNQLAHEILHREYDILEYKLEENQIQKYYKSTIEKDTKAKDIVEFSQNQGIVLTGSLALRYAGAVYRTEEESLHDLDFVVPFNINENESTLKDLFTHKSLSPDITPEEFGNLTFKMIDNFTWFKEFKTKYPTYTKLHGFYGKEHEGFESYTLTGVIDGEFYKEDGTHLEIDKNNNQVNKAHKRGEYIKNTGYIIDHFLRFKESQEEHENYFKLWKEIMIAKLKMGRAKDIIDYKYFVPFTKSKDSYNFYYKDWVYQSLDVSNFKGNSVNSELFSKNDLNKIKDC